MESQPIISQPIVSQPLASFSIPGTSYGYSGAPVPQLLSSDNTIAMGLIDESGSTHSYARQMEACIKEIIMALRGCNRADNLIYRQCHFSTNYREHHGFTPLSQINIDQYDGCYCPGGQTTLYDSSIRAINEIVDYGEKQTKLHYNCNAILFVISDGRDCGSTHHKKNVKEALEQAIAGEKLESFLTYLIGVNDDPDIQRDLEKLQKDIGFSMYYPLTKTDKKSLGSFGHHMSQQIQSQSMALGTGVPSQLITL